MLLIGSTVVLFIPWPCNGRKHGCPKLVSMVGSVNLILSDLQISVATLKGSGHQARHRVIAEATLCIEEILT